MALSPEPGPPLSTTADPYADHAKALALVKRKREEWAPGRDAHLHNQWRNLLFDRGHHWIFFDQALGGFRPVRTKPGTVLCTTNRFSSTMHGLISVLTRVEPRLTFRPATPEPEDRAAADVADRAMAVIEQEVDIRLVRQHLGAWAGLTGGAWLEAGYDPDPRWGLMDVPAAGCVAGCGAEGAFEPGTPCPTCGAPTEPAMDPMGQPVMAQIPRGRMFLDVVPMFEMYFDPALPVWSQHRACVRIKSLSLDVAKARWPHLRDSISATTGANAADRYLDQITTLPGAVDRGSGQSAYFSAWGQSLGGGGRARVTEAWYWQLPDEDYPKGLLCITLGETQVAHCGPLPTTALTSEGGREPFLPYVWFPQQLVPGSLWPKTVADDLASKQVQRNQIETIAMRIAQRMANPVWLKPSGANIQAFPSDPGGVIEYNALGPSPAKPERIPGQPITPGLMQFIQAIDRDFEEESSLYEIMKGSRPTGVSAGVSLQLLQERATHRFGPMLIMWEEGWAKTAGFLLEIFRQYATADRILRVQGKDGAWQVSKFQSADLRGRVDIVPEAGSSLPRSSLVERAEMEQLLSMGILDGRDPAIRYKVLAEYGKTHLLDTLAYDTKNADMEQEAFQRLAESPQALPILATELAAFGMEQQQATQAAQMAQAPPPAMAGPGLAPAPPLPPPPAPPTYGDLVSRLRQQGIQVPRVREFMDDHAIHATEHRRYGKSEPAYWQWPEPVARLYEMHIAEHQRVLAQRQQGPPPPAVSVALRGELGPEAALQLAGLGDESATTRPSGAGGGSGLLAQPRQGPGSGNAGRRAAGQRQNPLRTGSSPQRLAGEMREMAQRAT